MKALVFRHSLREALAFVGGRLTRRAYTTTATPTGLRDVPEPTPPSADWALCNTTVSGICGSDAKEIFLHGALDNPLTALLSFPHVLGHEAVAQRHDTGARVVVNPGCRAFHAGSTRLAWRAPRGATRGAATSTAAHSCPRRSISVTPRPRPARMPSDSVRTRGSSSEYPTPSATTPPCSPIRPACRCARSCCTRLSRRNLRSCTAAARSPGRGRWAAAAPLPRCRGLGGEPAGPTSEDRGEDGCAHGAPVQAEGAGPGRRSQDRGTPARALEQASVAAGRTGRRLRHHRQPGDH